MAIMGSAVIRAIKLEEGTERERVGMAAVDGWPREDTLRRCVTLSYLQVGKESDKEKVTVSRGVR